MLGLPGVASPQPSRSARCYQRGGRLESLLVATNLTVEGIDYDVSASTGGVGVLGDYYPTGGGLRVSGGLFKSNIGSSGRATGTVDVGSGTYAGVDLRTEVETERSIAPMVAVGYDGQIGAGWGLSADLGAIYTGGFKTSITDSCD